jgi:hypothetical protein
VVLPLTGGPQVDTTGAGDAFIAAPVAALAGTPAVRDQYLPARPGTRSPGYRDDLMPSPSGLIWRVSVAGRAGLDRGRVVGWDRQQRENSSA